MRPATSEHRCTRLQLSDYEHGARCLDCGSFVGDKALHAGLMRASRPRWRLHDTVGYSASGDRWDDTPCIGCGRRQMSTYYEVYPAGMTDAELAVEDAIRRLCLGCLMERYELQEVPRHA